MIRSSELQGAQVLTEAGQSLGRVTELRIRDGALDSIICGPKGQLQRFWRSRAGRRISSTQIRSLAPGRIIVRA